MDAGQARLLRRIDWNFDRIGSGFVYGRGRMTMLSMWFQGTDAVSVVNLKLLTIFLGLVALAMVVQAIALIVLATMSSKASKSLTESIQELKLKTLPLIESAAAISRTTEALLRENAPKVRVIADNLVQTSEALVEASYIARSAVQQFDATIADAHLRTQRQVARVDGMMTATLNTTVEIVETISHGIRIPAQKIAAIAGQAKVLAEGIFAKLRSMVAGSPFGDHM